MSDVSKRILEYMVYKNLKPMEFMFRLGYKSDGNYARLQSGEEPSNYTLEKLKNAFPELNMKYIMHGDGPLEIDMAREETEPYNIKVVSEESQEIARLTGENKRLLDELTFLRELVKTYIANKTL